MNYFDLLKLAAPETIIVLTALAALVVDSFGRQDLSLSFRSRISAMVSCLGCIGAIGWMVALPIPTGDGGGMLMVNPLTVVVKTGILVLTVFTLLLSTEASFTEHVGEYFALVLLGAVGMMFLASAEDILMIFVSLELTSLSLYILAGFNKRSPQSAEAALKYFLFGGMSAALTLFGFSLLYGLSGSTNLSEIALAIHGPTLDPLLILAIVLTVIGFGFKLAAAPFHLWAPDAYEGAPTPSAAFIASGSKLASVFIFARVMMLGFKGAAGSAALEAWVPGWVAVLAMVAAASMVLGNLVALVQSNVRRLLAYSAIAHAGYMLLGVMAHQGQSLAALVYYGVTYGLTTVGAFGVVAVVERQTGGSRLSDFAGLSRRAPVTSICMMIFMLSLAGIPPLAGFFGKFYLFASVLSQPGQPLALLWLVVLAIAMSAVSLYYYLQVLKQIYVVPGEATDGEAAGSTVIWQVALGALAILVVVLGAVPEWLVAKLSSAVQLAGM